MEGGPGQGGKAGVTSSLVLLGTRSGARCHPMTNIKVHIAVNVTHVVPVLKELTF